MDIDGTSLPIFDREVELSKAQKLLALVRAAAPASPILSASPLPLSEPLENIKRQEKRLIDALLHAAKTLQTTTGRQVMMDLGIDADRVSAIASPSTGPEGQVPPQRQQNMEDVGVRMSDLELTNRAPVQRRQ